MSFKNPFLCLLGTVLLLGSETAHGGSTFQFVLDPATQSVSPSGSASATLVLRETHDGTGSELLDGTDGPGLFSFSVSISQDASTSGTPATISSAALEASLEPFVSGVNLIGPAGAHTGVDLHGAIGFPPAPLTDGPATGAAGILDIPLATLNLTGSSVLGDTTDFLSSSHPMGAVFLTLDGTGTPINIAFGIAGQLSTVPEPAAQTLLMPTAVALVLMRRRRRR